MSIIDPRQGPRSRPHHDPRAFAWELMTGFPPSRHGSRRAPSRADLPDVDFPAPPPRPRVVAAIVERVMRLFVRGRAADSAPSAADDMPIGEWVDPPIFARPLQAARGRWPVLIAGLSTTWPPEAVATYRM